jgi:hypothetical protein
MAQYEFEDVISEVDNVDMVAPVPYAASKTLLNLRRIRNVVRACSGRHAIPSYDPIELDRNYDLFFGIFHFAPQLTQLRRIKRLRQRCRIAACFILELWPPWIDREKAYLELLKEFDYVFLLFRASIPGLNALTGVPTLFLPGATNAERFSPWPSPPARTIDFYSYGRRVAAVHEAMRKIAAEQKLTYLFDTVTGGGIADPVEHRTLQANLINRSRYVLASRVNENPSRVARTGGVEAVPVRYFEAAAGGGISLGSAPDCSDYRECFDWEDATITLPSDPRKIGGFLSELERDPRHLDGIRLNGVVNSLRRHDWLNRWSSVLQTVGLSHTPQMTARATRLEHLAMCAMKDSASPLVPAQQPQLFHRLQSEGRNDGRQSYDAA